MDGVHAGDELRSTRGVGAARRSPPRRRVRRRLDVDFEKVRRGWCGAFGGSCWA